MTDGRRLFFVCYPDTNSTIGGVKQIYRQVELLHQAGWQAWVLQEQPGFRADWFPSEAPVLDLQSFLALPLDPLSDWIVLPETWLPNVPGYLAGIPKIIFNQNAYYTFGLEGRVNLDTLSLYQHPDVRGVVTVSDDNRCFLVEGCGIGPEKVHTILNGIDGQLFFPPERKLRRIVFLARKHLHHARTVQLMASQRPFLQRYEFRELPRLSHPELAAELRESLVFLSCGHPEGFGLPLAEAIACGCITVGYHGLAGRDYCKPGLYQVEFGDLLGFLLQLEAALREFESAPEATTNGLIAQALALRERYALDKERERCLEVWDQLTAPIPA
jgi:glycosyltransferase involved in cell wall biosynthesis